MARANTSFQLVASAAVVLSLVGACGGQSLTDAGEDPADEKESGQGNAGTTAGKSAGQGATGQGGASAGEGDGGSTGATTNRAGSPSRTQCEGPSANDPHAPGGCTAALPRWMHDPATGMCMPIIYGGCGATENNYDSLAACQEACPNQRPSNLDACDAASDCMLTLNSCCGSHLASGFTAHDLIAHNVKYQDQLDRCQEVDCVGPGEDLNGERKFFVPECVQKECRVVDLRTSEVTACDMDDDCRLRLGAGCCEGCGAATDLISVRKGASFENLVCGDEIPPCLPCVGTIPESAVPICQQGHCSIAYLQGTP